MSSIIDRISELGIVPVVVIDDPADAPALAGALRDGGLPIAEFTFRTDAAVAAIRAAAAACPDVLVGAGSVLLPGAGRRRRRGRRAVHRQPRHRR